MGSVAPYRLRQTSAALRAIEAANAPPSGAILREIDSAGLVQAMRQRGSRLPSGLLWWLPFVCGMFVGGALVDQYQQQVAKSVRAATVAR